MLYLKLPAFVLGWSARKDAKTKFLAELSNEDIRALQQMRDEIAAQRELERILIATLGRRII